MKKLLTSCLMALLVAGPALAAITFSGDARFRPRIDMKDYGDYPTTLADGTVMNTSTDIYHIWRARLHADAQIGDGWFWKSTLGVNALAQLPKANSGNQPNSSSLANSTRQDVSWMLNYFGLKKEGWGFAMGLLPLGSYDNPGFDLHFYPDMPGEFPFYIWSNDAAYGFAYYNKMGIGRFGMRLLVDDDNVNTMEVIDPVNGTEDVDTADGYTLTLDYTIKMMDKITISPTLFYSIADDYVRKPLTIGFNVYGVPSGPFNTKMDAGFFFTSNGEAQADGSSIGEYSGMLGRVRFKVPMRDGKDGILVWYDYTSVDWTDSDLHTAHYLWLHYNWVPYKSEMGSFHVRPTLRMLMHNAENDSGDTIMEASRTKLEVTFEIKF